MIIHVVGRMLSLPSPTNHLLPNIIVLNRDLDWQRVLIAAIGIHHPHAPGARFVVRLAVAQVDNVLPVGTPGGRNVAGQVIDQRGNRTGEGSQP